MSAAPARASVPIPSAPAVEECVRLLVHDCPGQILCWRARCRRCDATLLDHLSLDGMHGVLERALGRHAAATDCFPAVDGEESGT